MGEDEEEIVAEGMDVLGEMAGELGMGGVEGELGAGVDEVDHGFGLGEVESAVEEGAPGEFAGFGEGCTGAEEGVEDLSGDEGTAVATDLDGILAGVGAWGAEDGEEDFVDATVFGVDVAVMDGVGGGNGGKRGRRTTGLEAAVGDGECARAGDADHRQSAGSGRGGDGGDGIGGDHAGWEVGLVSGDRRRPRDRSR